jgi:hypothetical protein
VVVEVFEEAFGLLQRHGCTANDILLLAIKQVLGEVQNHRLLIGDYEIAVGEVDRRLVGVEAEVHWQVVCGFIHTLILTDGMLVDSS